MNIVRTKTETQELQDKPDLPPVHPCQVFLIEDDLDDRILAGKELSSSEYVKDVVMFGDGKELIDHMCKHGFMDRSVMLFTPILILADIEMPRKDGLEVIKELKADPLLQSIPLVVVTGTESEEKLDQAKGLGASGVFRKPLNKDMLNRFFQQAWQWPPEELWR